MLKLKFQINLERIYEQYLKLYNIWPDEKMETYVQSLEYLLVINDRFSKYGTRHKPSNESLIETFEHYKEIVRRRYNLSKNASDADVLKALIQIGYYYTEYRCANYYIEQLKNNEAFLEKMPKTIISYNDRHSSYVI